MALERDEHEGRDVDENGDAGEGPLVGVAAGAVTFLTLGVAFGLMFLGVDYFWVAFPVGFGGGMPFAVALAKWYESERADEPGRDRAARPGAASGRSGTADEALERLRERYARGEIDDVEFETRVERLLETESVDDAEAFLGRDDERSERTTDPRERRTDPRERTADDADEVERA
ncbi:SHOCT domain-containing protein [Halosimplex salinum]|uniref:SHOCT domain-containing protein n=1 Tax=Halosimplex salinum TaxID=1710538 RepID=UPI000F47D87D|nr:SHOCT domain-containing protein [Halosimplex salinum]